MTVHIVLDVKVLDKDTYAEYVRIVPPMVKKFGGRYLARGGKITPLEGSWRPERVVVLEFDSAEQFHKFFNSPEYLQVAPLRRTSTISNMIMIETAVLP